MEPQQLEEADAAAIAYCEKHGLDPATVSVEFRDTGNGMQAVGHLPIPYNPTWPSSTPPSAQMPSVGRTVHYVSYGTPGGEYPSVCRAAIVTAVQDGVPFIGVAVLNPAGMFFHSMEAGGCHFHEGELETEHTTGAPLGLSYPGGTWHWPERM